MPFRFEIRVTPGQVNARVPGTDIHRVLPFGDAPHLPGPRPGEGVPPELQAVRLATLRLHRELASLRPLAFNIAKLLHQFDYDLVFDEGTLVWPVEDLVEQLHLHLRLRCLTIDGQDRTIPLWRRNLDLGLSLLLTFALPWGVVLASWWWMPPFFQSSALLFLAFLLAVMYATLFAGAGLWLGLTRHLLPVGYRRALVQARRIGAGGLFVRFWQRLLG